MPGLESSDLFGRPTSVFLSGGSRALLNWVAYALVEPHRGGFVWTDVHFDGEVRDDGDLVNRDLLPRDRFYAVLPGRLGRDDFSGNVALGGLVRSEALSEGVRRFADFLRLPPPTQALISRLARRSTEGGPAVLVLSNAHRVIALYPRETIGPTLCAVLDSGLSVLMTWADARFAGRFEFEHALHLEGSDLKGWRRAVLVVEKGASTGPLRQGSEVVLGEYPPVASVLDQFL